jgi:polysaccharide export outer membrane protein
MKKYSVRALLLVVFLTAVGCVPNRKLVYLQQKDLRGSSDIVRDSVLRTHPMKIAEYRIQPLDILNIQFETLTDDTDSFNFLNKLSSQNRQGGGAVQPGMVALNGIFVNTEGMVEYPVLGSIRLAGLTIFEAEKAIRAVASRFVPDVVVRVRMLNFRFTILGEVLQENVVVANNPRLTLMEAIGMAGGFTDLADRSLVKIVRQKGATSEVFYVNLLDESFIESPYYFVQQNDVIVVPPLKQRPFRRYFAPNLGILASALSLAVLWITIANNSNN